MTNYHSHACKTSNFTSVYWNFPIPIIERDLSTFYNEIHYTFFSCEKKSIPVFQEAKILFPLAYLSCSLFLEARKSFNSKDENHGDKSAWYKKSLKIPNLKQ
jgi:hypothetical protein